MVIKVRKYTKHYTEMYIICIYIPIYKFYFARISLQRVHSRAIALLRESARKAEAR